MQWKTTVLLAALSAALPHAAAADSARRPAVPANLEVPSGYTLYLTTHAVGTQAYICLPSGGGVAWTFYGPQATLFGHNGKQAATHFLSPNPAENGAPRATWQHN